MSNKNSILLVDPEFDPNTAPACNLLLKITSDSFSYAIIDKSSKQLKVIYDLQDCNDGAVELAKSIKSDSYLSLPFREIKASAYTINSIAIPNELYNAVDLDNYSRFFTEEQSNTLYVQPVSKFGFNSIFTFQNFVEQTLMASMQDCKRYDHTAPALAIAAKLSGDHLILDFTAGSFNALYMKNGKLIFQHYYEVENAEEFNYYLLLMIKQLNIDKIFTQVQVSGIVNEDDPYFSALTKYFNTIELNPPVNDDIDHSLLEDMPAHYYTSLLALDLCE